MAGVQPWAEPCIPDINRPEHEEVPPGQVNADVQENGGTSPPMVAGNPGGAEDLQAKPPALYESPQGNALFAFADPEAIKKKVRAAKDKPNQYDVKNFYKNPETSVFSRIAQNPLFENVTLGVISFNAVWIAVDTDRNHAVTLMPPDDGFDQLHPLFITADVLFFAYFSMELFIRFMAFQSKKNCIKDFWFVFDSTLVLLYALDPFVVTILAAATGGGSLPFPSAILRLFRLARLSRLVRMLRSLPELVIMVKGIVSAVSTVSYTLGLLVLVTYVFGIALRQLSDEEGDIRASYFKSVPDAMYSLLVYGTFLDNLAEFMDNNRAESTPCLILCVIYVILASMTILNMLIGILCQVISSVAAEERESMMVDKVHEKFGEIVKTLDKNNSGTLSWAEFQVILSSPLALKALESVDVDPEGLIDAAEDYFFEDGVEREIGFSDFMGMVLELRGGQSAMVKDVISLGKRFSKKMLQVKDIMDTLDGKLEEIISGA
jgi:hypothetical protein